ncbi:PREDICTED: uncharacterized protein LOC109157086 [Ipomoea nil]|uniref:uncharacterized protein LOC109157086 n=1 Tax=Ipomoea nil TaxID=35883 RepID=UPI000901AE2D|nr:PREDICTED: uncharacterized protein LOC109157086 [Ipomoea nil]
MAGDQHGFRYHTRIALSISTISMATVYGDLLGGASLVNEIRGYPSGGKPIHNAAHLQSYTAAQGRSPLPESITGNGGWRFKVRSLSSSKQYFLLDLHLPTMDGLKSEIKMRNKWLDVDGLKFTYNDQEGHEIILACDEDLRLCFNCFRAKGQGIMIKMALLS